MNTENSYTKYETRRDEAISQLSEIIIANQTAMLVTCGSDHVIRSRPMLNINDRFDGDLYFLMDARAGAADALLENPRTNVAIAEPATNRYASITGTAKVQRDMKKAELLWNSACMRWFGTEKPNDSIALIKIDVEDAEYWNENQSLTNKITDFVSSISGGNPVAMDVAHEKVDWNLQCIDKDQIGHQSP